MHNRLTSFINRHCLFYDNKFGFRTQHFTTPALIPFMDKIAAAIDKGEYALGVFQDFSKVFDTVNHETLFAKIEKYGVSCLTG